MGSKKIRYIQMAALGVALFSCTQEKQNQISRTLQNWTGTNGVLDVFSGGHLMYRFIGIDKMTTAADSGDGFGHQTVRFGYGVMDLNFNYEADGDEKKVYFEVAEHGTKYTFYENPRSH